MMSNRISVSRPASILIAQALTSLLRTYRRFKDAKVGVYTIPFRFRGVGSTIRGEQTFDFESTLTTNLVFGFGSKYKEKIMLRLLVRQTDRVIGVNYAGKDYRNKNRSSRSTDFLSKINLSVNHSPHHYSYWYGLFVQTFIMEKLN